jgi:hypothetical protein
MPRKVAAKPKDVLQDELIDIPVEKTYEQVEAENKKKEAEKKKVVRKPRVQPKQQEKQEKQGQVKQKTIDLMHLRDIEKLRKISLVIDYE